MSKGKFRADKYFKSNITGDKLYTTSDGTPFLRNQDAKTHASSLEDKNIETFSRNTEVEAKAETTVTLTASEKETAKVEADKKAAAKKVAAAKKKADAKKQADTAKKAATNTAGAKKNSANTGSDQKTAK